MRKLNFIFLCLILSLFLHFLFFFLLSLRVEGKRSPLIYSWINIINKQDLSFSKREVIFPAGVDLSSDNIRKEYFYSPFIAQLYFRKENDYAPEILAPDASQSMSGSSRLKNKEMYFFLWEKESSFYPQQEESVSYKVFVSSYGKVLFMYPQKLPINSYGNLSLQEYIRNASFFLNDKFFWTNLEGVVK
jgi:hypothetical protein